MQNYTSPTLLLQPSHAQISTSSILTPRLVPCLPNSCLWSLVWHSQFSCPTPTGVLFHNHFPITVFPTTDLAHLIPHSYQPASVQWLSQQVPVNSGFSEQPCQMVHPHPCSPSPRHITSLVSLPLPCHVCLSSLTLFLHLASSSPCLC